ncbi:hypothetical protein EB796_009546 [Bugula neritina]|uniref:Cyclic nucleotide-binding domain-containing protein n=1 Tax=Bugula neritina TaxID=10212 RepID=A0A7J7K2H7_BUGNE|nr:hypothetical protein EB796_009546 [Bugula neritina]
MQREMCKLGWYQRVEPNRVIIREGQRAYNFYFILSGTVVITEWNEVMKSSQTKCMLQRGMEFGEQAVFKKAYRSATVISRSTTELLCLDASDLASIYICGWDAPIRDPHIIHFLSTLYFLNNFPMELLQTNSQAIMFHHFRQGKVLVANSNVAQWIYIVKSGSLMVIKKLKDNKSFNSLQKFKEGEFNRFLEFAANQSFGKSSKYNFKANKLAKSNLPTQGGSVTGLPATINCKKYQASGATSNSTHRLSEDNSKKSTNDVKLPPLVERRKLDAPSPDADDSSFNHNITDEEADCNGYPTYIKIAVLEKGQYFGLSSTVFENQPSVSLISNGADCLLLSKQFFFKHCSEKMLTQLKEKEFPYPTEEQLQMKLTAHLKWIRFKSQYYAENVQRVMNL